METTGIDFNYANRFGGRVAAVVYRGSEAEVWLDCGRREVVALLPRSVVESAQVVIATTKDGAPLTETDGFARLVVPGDQAPARFVGNIARIEVIDL